MKYDDMIEKLCRVRSKNMIFGDAKIGMTNYIRTIVPTMKCEEKVVILESAGELSPQREVIRNQVITAMKGHPGSVSSFKEKYWLPKKFYMWSRVR